MSNQPRTSNPARTLLILFILACLGIAVTSMVGPASGSATVKVRTSEFVQKLSRGQVSSANWLGKEIHGSLGSEDGSRAYEVTVPEVDSAAGAILLTQLMNSNVNWTIEKPPVSSAILGALSVIAFPLIVIALIYFMVLRPAQMRLN